MTDRPAAGGAFASCDKLNDPIIAHVSHDVTKVHPEQTVSDVLQQLRRQPLGEKIVYIYVVDATERLVGVLPTRRLLGSAPETAISAIMISRVIAIPYLATVLEACEWFIQYRFLAFPVIDEQRRLVGVVDLGLFTDEIMEVSTRHSFDDVFQLIGLNLSDVRNAATPWRMFYGRFPWLLCNIAGGLLCALLAGLYEQLLDTLLILALFMPVVLALSESVSMQSMTLTLQRLHGPPRSHHARTLSRELAVALLLGLACGPIVGLAAWLWKGMAAPASAIGLSVALAVMTSCALGIGIPTMVHRLKIDPRVAAGPIVLAFADLATLLVYFNLSLAFAS